jgi:anaerobic magnesium-protoporphyrin IX monomethyl ester cyclase
MRILLLAMPDSVDMIDQFAKLPNLALASLAGSLRNHDVSILDLILYKPAIRRIIDETISRLNPQVIGLSAMTFQFDTMLRIAHHIRNTYPGISLVAGGYHVSLLADELTLDGAGLPLDFLVRGEGEETFSELADRIGQGTGDFNDINGLSYCEKGTWIHNPDRQLADLADLPLPDRTSRLNKAFHWLDMPVEVAETSRGCPFNCKFCSITRMYGKKFRRFPIERIIADLISIRQAGTKAVFFADDNITYDAEHFSMVCKAIVEHGLDDMWFIVQVSAAGIAKQPDLAADMARANLRTAFVGFESMDASSLKDMKKPTSPEINRKTASLLRSHGIAIIAGIIVGYPDDTKETIARNFRLLRSLRPAAIYAQYLTPYPKTELREEMLRDGLVVNEDNFRAYDGFSNNIRTLHLSQTSLYRLLRKELIKSYFSPSLILGNRLLKAHGGYYAKAMIRSLLIRIANFIKGGELRRRLDI